jgi:hypothetical protein
MHKLAIVTLTKRYVQKVNMRLYMLQNTNVLIHV